jgi:hypothetical protein
MDPFNFFWRTESQYFVAIIMRSCYKGSNKLAYNTRFNILSLYIIYQNIQSLKAFASQRYLVQYECTRIVKNNPEVIKVVNYFYFSLLCVQCSFFFIWSLFIKTTIFVLWVFTSRPHLLQYVYNKSRLLGDGKQCHFK